MQTQLDPGLLHPHPHLRDLPAWADDDARFTALCDDVAEVGICAPLLITARNEIITLDDRHLWRAAKRMQMPQIPVVIVETDAPLMVLLQKHTHTWHMTKGQRAYFLFPFYKAIIEAGKVRRLEKMKKGQCFPVSALSAPTAFRSEEFAARHGLSARLMDQASEVVKLFAKHPEYRAQMEPTLFGPPEDAPGLGAIIAGHAGQGSTRTDREPNGQLQLFARGLDSFLIRLKKEPELFEGAILGMPDNEKLEEKLQGFETLALTLTNLVAARRKALKK